MVTELLIKNFNNYTELKYETNTTAMANIGYKINSNNKVSFNSLYINTSTQSKEEYTGYIDIKMMGMV
jgi:predicted methyltransferase